jgi:hypothetical protein
MVGSGMTMNTRMHTTAPASDMSLVLDNRGKGPEIVDA